MIMKVFLEKYFVNTSSFGVKRFYRNLKANLDQSELEFTEIHSQNALFKLYDGLLISPVHAGSFLQKKQIIFVHDFITFKWYHSNFKKFFLKIYYYFLFKSALRVFVFTNAEKKFIIDKFNIDPKKIFLFKPIYNDFLVFVKKNTNFSNDFENDFENDFFLLITNNKTHKNNDVVIDFFKNNSEHNLVVVGLKQNDFSNIKFYNNIDDYFLIHLLKTCNTVISPSLEEGFNLPLFDSLSFLKRPIVNLNQNYFEIYGHLPFYLVDWKSELKNLIVNNDFKITQNEFNDLKNKNLNSWKDLIVQITSHDS